ncbi:hypothetical protein SprV_0301121300 [Sparganum proliferum]
MNRLVEGFRQIQECIVRIGKHFVAPILELGNNEGHVSGSTMSSETSLTSRVKPVFQMAIEPIEDANEDLNVEQCSHVHPDIVDPLHLSNVCSYLLTSVDRFVRWPEAIPLSDIVALTVVKALLSLRVAIFGALSAITTDCGAQFESNLFQSLLPFLGCTRIRTTAYHPAANGMVEWFHHRVKASLRAAADPEN